MPPVAPILTPTDNFEYLSAPTTAKPSTLTTTTLAASPTFNKPDHTTTRIKNTSEASNMNFQLNNSSSATEHVFHQRFMVSVEASFQMENGDVRNMLKISIKDSKTGIEEMNFIINIKDVTHQTG